MKDKTNNINKRIRIGIELSLLAILVALFAVFKPIDKPKDYTNELALINQQYKDLADSLNKLIPEEIKAYFEKNPINSTSAYEIINSPLFSTKVKEIVNTLDPKDNNDDKVNIILSVSGGELDLII